MGLAALDAATGRSSTSAPLRSGSVSALAVSGQTVVPRGRVQQDRRAQTPRPRGPKRDNRACHRLEPEARRGHRRASRVGPNGLRRRHVHDDRRPAARWSSGARRLDGVRDRVEPAPATVNAGVDALAVSRSAVYVGGDFNFIASQPRRDLAALDASTGKLTG